MPIISDFSQDTAVILRVAAQIPRASIDLVLDASQPDQYHYEVVDRFLLL